MSVFSRNMRRTMFLIALCCLPLSARGEFQSDSEETLRQKAAEGQFSAGRRLCFWEIPDKLDFCERAARLGDYQSTYMLWEVYENGYRQVPQDREKSLYWAQFAADQGYQFGWLQLGLRYLYGVNLPQDDKQAFKCFKKAHAFYLIGEMYERGHGVRQDYAKAFSYYQKQIEEKPDTFWEVAFRMGWLTWHGLGVKQDEKAAQEWFHKAAKALSRWSSFTGIATAQSTGAIEADHRRPSEAKEQAQIAEARLLAEKEDAEAQFYLGMAYNGGLGVKSNQEEALKWWRKAAQNGHVQAMYNVGIENLQVDPEEARTWLQKASERGDVRATYVIGRMKLSGVLTKADLNPPKPSNPSDSPKNWIRLSDNPADVHEGLQLIQQTAEEGLSEAQGILAIFYALGAGLPQDMDMAEKWWQRCEETQQNLYVLGVPHWVNPRSLGTAHQQIK